MEGLLQWRPLFRQMAPFKQLLDSIRTSPGWPSLEIQEQLYVSLFNDEVTESFPIDPSYRSKLIRSLCKEIEDACEEVYEPLLREWNAIPCDSPASFAEDAGCYVTYELDSSNEPLLLHLRVAPKQNEVGLRLWEAGFMLAEYILSAAELTQARQVVELGAGVGLVGLVAACCCDGVDSVVMTDGDPAVLKYLRHNVEVNMASYSSKGSAPAAPVSVQHVDWTDLSTLEPLLAQDPCRPRLVLGADVIYDPAQVPALTCAIRELLLASAGNHADAGARDDISQRGFKGSTLLGASDRVGDAIAIIACTLRNPDTYELFLRHVEAAGMACEDATIEARRKIAETLRTGSPFYYDKGAVRIHNISLRRIASGGQGDDHKAS